MTSEPRLTARTTEPAAPPAGLRVSPRAARRALVGALNHLLDEGITDYSARTRASRRRMAALYAGFVHAEEVLAALRRRGRSAPRPGAALAELEAVLRHLLYWATVDGVEDPSPATRAAITGVRRALRHVTGSDAGAHHPALLDCERCGEVGAELAATADGSHALCAGCSGRRGRRVHAL